MSDRQKVFCVGFMKTGTTALNQALTILGYRVSHRSWRLLDPIMNGDWETVKAHGEAWDALEDNPIPQIFKQLDAQFPGSKFILSMRDSEKWYNSVSYHIGDLRSPMHEWVFGFGKGLPKEDKAHTINVYEAHNREVLNHFKDRPGDLLIMDVTKDGQWKPICDHLGVEVPSEAFPHANRTKYNKDKNQGLKRQFKYWKKRLAYPVKVIRYRSKNLIPSPEDRLKTSA